MDHGMLFSFFFVFCSFQINKKIIPVPTIVFIGASETSGYELPEGESYVDKFDSLLTNQGLEYAVTNISFPGAATSDGKTILSNILYKNDNIHTIFISLGLSDVLYGVSTETIYNNLEEIIKMIKTNNPKTNIQIMEGEIFQYHKIPNLPSHESKYYFDYKRIYKRLLLDYQIKTYPFLMQTFLGKTEYFISDKVHPSGKGTTIMAEFVYGYFIESIPK